jgi:prophage antirepressor-like protein
VIYLRKNFNYFVSDPPLIQKNKIIKMNTNFISVVTDDGVEHTIRVAGTVYEPYFVGVDVCGIMELKNHNDALLKLVDINHKKELKNLLKEENQGQIVPFGVACQKPVTSLGDFDLKTLSHNDGRVVVLSEPGLYSLLEGSRLHKNKKKIKESVERWLFTIKYENNDGLQDIFSFISKLDLTIDITSNWFKDLWYPLSKSRGLPGEAPTKVENQPIIVTQNLLEWMGYKGRKEADKQNDFSKLLKSLKISHKEIDYKHPLAIEYPGVQKESKQLMLSNNLEKKRWICMDPRAFKKVVMRLNTENAEVVRDYYLNLEEAMFAYGEYTMNFLIDRRDLELSGMVAKLAIKDTELEQEKEARLKAEKEAEDHKQYSLILKELTFNNQKRPLNEAIYISTSKAYANQNRYKVGGVEGMDKLKPRFSGYNGRSSVDDMWYYSDLFKVANFRECEKRINDVLGRFRERKSKEIYVLHYKDLRRYVEWITQHYEDEIEKFNEELDMLIGNLNRRQLRPVIPPPYQGTSATITRIVDGIPINTTIDDSVEEQFKHKIKVYLDTLDSTPKIIKRTDLFSKVISTLIKLKHGDG